MVITSNQTLPRNGASTEAKMAGVQGNLTLKNWFSGLKAKVIHMKDAISSKKYEDFACKKLGLTIIGSSRNVVRQEALASEQDFEAAQKLLEGFKQLQTTKPDQFTNLHVCWDSDAKITKAITDGICSGIRLDIAHRYLNGEQVGKIIEDNAKGVCSKSSNL